MIDVSDDGTYVIPRLPAADEYGSPILNSLEAWAYEYTTRQAYVDVVLVPGMDNCAYDFVFDPIEIDSDVDSVELSGLDYLDHSDSDAPN